VLHELAAKYGPRIPQTQRLRHAPDEGLRFRIDAPMSGRLGRLHEASKTS
jgi:hypothetical protein